MQDNEPATRPLLWHWPDDPAAIAADDQFLLGPDLLVAPVLDEGATTRRVYFPAHPGGWIDFQDGTAYAGEQALEVPGPLGRLPLFVRAGAVLPLAGAGSETDAEKARSGEAEARAFGVPSRSFCLVYQDDGAALDWADRPLTRFDLMP